MILYPSIHLKDGAVARLIRSGGDFRDAEILHPNPAERAAEFEAQNFAWLHLVDLNAAFGQGDLNVAAIEAILQRVKFPVQLSGGVRTMQDIQFWLDRGVARVVLTTAAVQTPELVREVCAAFPGRIAVKIDSRAGFVTTTGWTRSSNLRALDLALRVEEAGAAAVIYADINPDGALSEVNLEAIIDLAFALTVPVIASGGIHSMQELIELKENSHAGIAGLILGRALYNGTINAAEALAIAAA